MLVIFKIVYSLYDKNEPKENICGFELGYISFRNDEDIENYDELKNQPSMIFLTISELILALVEYEEKNLNYKEIIGADSSLSIYFKRVNKFTKIVVNGTFSITIETVEVLREAYNSFINFCRPYYSFLLSSVKNDLEYAFNKIEKII